MLDAKTIYKTASETFGPIASGFVIDSLEQMIPWLITMFFVVICDLITGVRKSLLMDETVRFSRAWRQTIGKAVTYFSFVVMAEMVNIAAGKTMQIDIYACLLVCAIEGGSILSNILKPKGYNLDLAGIIKLFCKKTMSIENEDLKDIIKRQTENEK